MKRDMDLVRRILLEAEAFEGDFEGFATQHHEIDGWSRQQVGYHILIMKQAGLVTAGNDTDEISLKANCFDWKHVQLTWAGHEFLDVARNTQRWEKAKAVMSKAGGFAFNVGSALLVEYMKREVWPNG